MKHIFHFMKKESVLTISFFLALLSAFVIPLDAGYGSYLDFKVLALLFCLMCIMSGFQSIGLFERMGRKMLSNSKNTRQLSAVLVLLCFLSSMLITNDVALITFVPFTIMVLIMAKQEKIMITVIVLQTIAANLGSMLTPIGNPQNLYLYSISGFSLYEFVVIMLPYTLVSFLLLLLCIRLIKPQDIILPQLQTAGTSLDKKAIVRYSILFLLCLLTVLHIIPFQLMLAIVLAVLGLMDRKLFKEVDYCLLFTFICFFIFIGNVGRMDSVVYLLSGLLNGFELEAAVIASQVVSNVPAALLLSGFTSQLKELLIGVNIGGLGTLIASLASLISYKFYVNTKGSDKLRYLLVFTIFNLCFLAVLMTMAMILTGIPHS